MNYLTYALAAGVLAVAGTAANAATCTVSVPPSGQTTTYTLEASSQAACYSGNDTNTIDSSTVIFGMDGWMLADKNDDTTSGDGEVMFTVAPVNGTQSGTWSIANPMGYENIFITLKAGNSFAAFLIDTLSGTWMTTRDLSHASIYYSGEPMAPVPLPAAGLMLLGGLGTMAALRRRRKTA